MNVIHSTEQYDFIPFQDENENWSIVVVHKMTGERSIVKCYDYHFEDHPFVTKIEGYPSRESAIAQFNFWLDDERHYKLVGKDVVRVRNMFK